MTTTSPATQIDLQADASSRQQRLAQAVRQLRTRATGSDPARPLLVLGAVLAPLGLAFILMGWWGAAHTVRLFEQIPYAISGGMLGLALVFAGAFSYFAYWLTQLVHAVRQDTDRNGAALERIEELLTTVVASSNPRLVADAAATAAAPKPGRPSRAGSRAATRTAAAFLATPHGTMFHRPDCAAVAGQENVRKVAANERGLTPCRICTPLASA